MEEKIKAVFDTLQMLDIKATPNNVSILDAVFNTLREIYSGEVAASAVDTDGQHGN
jgi:hypothetical protein